jgi:predicted transcriptional regulator
MTVLLSVKPEFVRRIFDGTKGYEYRRKPFRRAITRVIVYASAPVSMVVGEFVPDAVLSDEPGRLWRATKHLSGVSEPVFRAYFEGSQTGYAIRIGRPVRYATPVKLHETLGVRAPQSFCYLREAPHAPMSPLPPRSAREYGEPAAR